MDYVGKLESDLQVAEAGGDKALRAQAQSAQQHAALVQEMYHIAETADPDTLITGYSINEYLEHISSHAQVRRPQFFVPAGFRRQACEA